MALQVLGVRHHSPACARLVRDVIRATRPRFVLVEGPADMNDRLGELRLGHEPPLAVFTWYRDASRTHASWSPFCAYSPEWVALQEASRVGADFRFIDLPAWSHAFADIQNRYADHRGDTERRRTYTEALCERVGVDDSDTLWDHLFEQDVPSEVLRARLDSYFERLRDGAEAGPRDGPREAYMASCIAWALAQGGDVVVVCGGWHQPPLSRVTAGQTGPFPAPEEAPVDARHESWLVPYSNMRLDAFAGYQSGMPSPGFYEDVWRLGAEQAAFELITTVAFRLRAKRQDVSTADLVSALALARTLARMRGHAVLARTDVLDGLAGALLKDALDAPLPWSRRGTISPRTHPVLVEVVAALSGTTVGKLHHKTPRPPLVHDVEQRLANADLSPTSTPRSVRLELTAPLDRDRSRLLHQLRVLTIPGFTRRAGPASANDEALVEGWTIVHAESALSALIEAGAAGATLEAAALSRLEDALGRAADVAAIAAILDDAVFVGIAGFTERALEAVGKAIGHELDLAALGRATTRLHGLWRHGDLLGASGARVLEAALVAAFDRSLWLVEGLTGPEAPANDGHLQAIVAVRDLLRSPALQLDAARASEVLGRRAGDPAAPPAIRGAGLGFRWAQGAFPTPEEARLAAVRAIRASSRPSTFGDFLAGLFAVAREEFTTVPALVAAVDEVLLALTQDDFLIALPSLRMAFGWFPPRERERLARLLLERHGEDPAQARSLLRAPAANLAWGVALEASIDAVVARYGLGET